MAGFGAPPKPKKPAFNLKTAMEAHMRTHSKLAAATPKNQHADVYVRATGSEKFFFVGKALAAEGVCDAHSAVVLQARGVPSHLQGSAGAHICEHEQRREEASCHIPAPSPRPP